MNSDFVVTLRLDNKSLQNIHNADRLVLLWDKKELYAIAFIGIESPSIHRRKSSSDSRTMGRRSRESPRPSGNLGSSHRLRPCAGQTTQKRKCPVTRRSNFTTLPIKPDDQYVEFKWEGTDIENLSLPLKIVFTKKPDPQPSPYATEILLLVETTKDEKDPPIYFRYRVYVPTKDNVYREGDETVGKLERVGAGEKWDNGDKRTITIPIDKPDRLRRENRGSFNLQVVYGTDDNDEEKWKGKISARARMSNGEIISLMGPVELEMGDTDNGRIGSRRNRDFDFAK